MVPFTKQQAPTEGQGQHTQEFADALKLCEMRVLEIDPPTFETAKEGFNIPAFSVIIQGGLWGICRDQNQVIILDAHPNDKDRHAPYSPRLTEYAGFAKGKILKKSKSREVTRSTGIGNARISPNANPKTNPLTFEKFDPVGADKFAISRDALNPVMAEFDEKVLQETDAFQGIGIAPRVQKDPEQRDGHTVIGDGQDKNIDVHGPKFPIGAVETQDPFFPEREQTHHTGCHLGSGEGKIFKTSLNPPVIRVDLRLSAKCRGDLSEIDRSDTNQRQHKLGNKSYSGTMPVK